MLTRTQAIALLTCLETLFRKAKKKSRLIKIKFHQSLAKTTGIQNKPFWRITVAEAHQSFFLMWERDGERQRERGVCFLLLCGRKRKRRALQFAIGLLLYNFTTDETLCLPPMLSPQLPDGELWQVLNLFSSPVPSYCYTYTRARRTLRPIAHHHNACARVSCLIWSTNRHGDIITLLYVFLERLGDTVT